jgi:hypothetical protein
MMNDLRFFFAVLSYQQMAQYAGSISMLRKKQVKGVMSWFLPYDC